MEEEGYADGPDEDYKEEWSDLTLEEVILGMLKPEPLPYSTEEGKKTNLILTSRGYGISDFLRRLERHPDLISRPSKRAKMTRIRRVIKNTESIVKMGNRRSAIYHLIPLQHLEELKVKSLTNLVISLLMDSNGTISRDKMFEAVPLNDRWRGDLKVILPRLEEAGIVEDEGETIRCTGEAWRYDALVKRNSTFTLTSRTESLLSKLVDSLSERSANIPGFDMPPPEVVSKSGVIDIAVACLERAIEHVQVGD